MKKFIKITLLLSLILILLSACGKEKDINKLNNVKNNTQNNENLEDDKNDKNDEKDELDKDKDSSKSNDNKDNNKNENDNDNEQNNFDNDFIIDVEPTNNIELDIYSVDIDLGEPVLVASIISGDEIITPELIIDNVIDEMEDVSISVGIHKIETDGDTVIVSFKSDTAPVTDVGSGIEGAILDAIAQSLLDNLDDYNNIIFRIEDNEYATGHFEFEYNEVYLSK